MKDFGYLSSIKKKKKKKKKKNIPNEVLNFPSLTVNVMSILSQ